jgi:hypothetical protein
MEICLRALAPAKEDRYPDCRAMSFALEQWLARNAPIDATRVAAFVHDLFTDDIQRERAERDRLLRLLS